MDGSFLQSAALAGGWDVVIFLHASFATAVERAVPRYTALLVPPARFERPTPGGITPRAGSTSTSASPGATRRS
ncbi:hypothetical protein [Aeromicrobium sp.]|uniref:hypothetical protein n=1 Tax=Aeromicrobium sp. TaxID=1871063 RepID=UPI003D6A0760